MAIYTSLLHCSVRTVQVFGFLPLFWFIRYAKLMILIALCCFTVQTCALGMYMKNENSRFADHVAKVVTSSLSFGPIMAPPAFLFVHVAPFFNQVWILF